MFLYRSQYDELAHSLPISKDFMSLFSSFGFATKDFQESHRSKIEKYPSIYDAKIAEKVNKDPGVNEVILVHSPGKLVKSSRTVIGGETEAKPEKNKMGEGPNGMADNTLFWKSP